jgi:hypothetical protein
MNEQEQLALAKRLLIEEEADNPRWIINLIYEILDQKDQELLRDFERGMSSA